MKFEPLMDALVQILLFLEFSDPEIVDEDASIGMMEQIAVTLHKLRPADKEQFIVYLKCRASHSESEKERQAIEQLADNLGLVAD